MDTTALITATEAEILQAQDWSFPVLIAYGPGRLAEISPKALELGITNALIVTGAAEICLYRADSHTSGHSRCKIQCFFRDFAQSENDEIGAGKAAFQAGALTRSLPLAVEVRWMAVK